MAEDEYCAQCGSRHVTIRTELDTVEYGRMKMLIQVLVPVLKCESCGFRWTDWRAEEARDDAVQHLRM